MRASPLAVVVRIVCTAFWLCAGTQVVAQPTTSSRHHVLRTLREVLDTPEAEVDFAKAKVTIDRLVDPTIDAQGTLAKIDAAVADVKAMLPIGASTEQRAGALRAYLYDPGPWNGGRVFAYNFAHPDGTYLPDKLLANYLRTRKGNCISMPFLYIAMAQKLGLTVSVATAPNHVFARLRDDRGVWHNIEATSGGYTRRDVLYHQDHRMTPEALANGLYMRTLSKRETVHLMAQLVEDHYSENGPPELLMAVSDMLIERDPKDVYSILGKADAYNESILRRFVNRYTKLSEMSVGEREEFIKMRGQRELLLERAAKLGWRMPPKEEIERYRSIVNGAAGGAKREEERK